MESRQVWNGKKDLGQSVDANNTRKSQQDDLFHKTTSKRFFFFLVASTEELLRSVFAIVWDFQNLFP